MMHRTSSERMGEAMTRARKHWQHENRGDVGAVAAGAAPAPPAFTVALSRQSGANGAIVARAVGERLGWAVYDRELIEKIAQEMGLQSQLLESVDERRSNWLMECLRSFTSRCSIGADGYAHRLSRILFSLAAHGNCVIVGRGAAQLLPEATTLRVRAACAWRTVSS
jgi:cytidylate kinase